MRGFTLIELLLVVAIIVVLAGLSIPLTQTTYVANDVSAQTYNLLSTLRRAQHQALVGQQGTPWGVYFDSGNQQYILFSGTEYASRDQSFDDAFHFPAVMNISTDFGNEISFSLGSGRPSVVGAITVVGSDGLSGSIVINSYGTIELGN